MSTDLLQITFADTTLEVYQSKLFSYLVSTEEVARGYGVTSHNIRQHKLQHKEELKEGEHFITSISVPLSENFNASNTDSSNSVSNTNTENTSNAHSPNRVTNCHAKTRYTKRILWTKLGVIYLGFFIKSERARNFRRFAADLVLGEAYSPPACVNDDTATLLKGVGLGVELTDLAPMHLINRVCYFRNLGLNQDETAKLTMLYPKTVSQIEAKLRELGVELKKIPHGPRRKADMQNALKLALKGGK
ncbi:hypothetical protein [Geovibrio ferrireducens]|uniref:hypothetical protein n=1 Tax=Geovibrio ferrireducens TaxID=46201 RepID=UPI0022477BA2|nr:hypothetical protein [Geovibrio ferrireducens]